MLGPYKSYGARIRWPGGPASIGPEEDIVYPCAKSKAEAKRQAQAEADRRGGENGRGAVTEVWRA